MSLHTWTRANRIIWRVDREWVSWFCLSEFVASTCFYTALRIFSLKKWGNSARTSSGVVLEYFERRGFCSRTMMRGRWKRVWPRGGRFVNCREWMNIMRVFGVFIPSYGAIERSSNRRATADSNVSFRIIWSAWRDEEWRFFRIMEILRLSHVSS